MSTRKQREANRRNARHSTGPRTDAGKQRSSQNALKHGLLAVQSVIPGEDPADYDSLLTEFAERFLPFDPYELSLSSVKWPMPSGVSAASHVSRARFSTPPPKAA